MDKKFKKLASAIMALGMAMMLLTGCGNRQNGTSVKSIQDKKVLTVGLISSNPPYEFQTANGKITGSDVLLIKKVAKALNVNYKIKSMDLDGLLPAMQAHKIDMVITAMSPTPERRQGAKFSNIYYKSTNTMVVRKNEIQKFKNNNFNNATIAVVNNSTQEAMIEKVFPKAKIKKLSKVTDLPLAVANNKADAFSIDLPTTTILLKTNPKLSMTSFRHHDSSAGAAVALPKDANQDLVNKINQVIATNKTQYAQWVVDYAKQVK